MSRPPRSLVRDRLGEMLFIAGKMTAYDAHKHYVKIFSEVTQRNVYYQLRRGVDQGHFDIEEVQEQGDFSWGTTSRKIYFKLNDAASPRLNEDIKEYFDGMKDENN